MHVGCNLNKCNSFISFSKNHNCIFKYFMVNCILLQIFVLSVWNIVVFENLQVASYSESIFYVIYYKYCQTLRANNHTAKYRKYLHSKALLSQFASLVKCFRLQMLCIKFMQLHLLRNTANNITYGWLLKSTTAKNTTMLQQTTT